MSEPKDYTAAEQKFYETLQTAYKNDHRNYGTPKDIRPDALIAVKALLYSLE